MSLFQCHLCGCVENSSCTSGYHSRDEFLKRSPEAYASYRKILGLKEGEPYPALCSVCVPAWFTEDGEYGVGPRPPGYKSEGKKYSDRDGTWHGRFERTFLPKGCYHTDEEGNLRHIETLLHESEMGHGKTMPYDEAPRYTHPEFRLPSRDQAETGRWRALMEKLARPYWMDPDLKEKIDTAAGGLPELVWLLVQRKAELSVEDVDVRAKAIEELKGQLGKSYFKEKAVTKTRDEGGRKGVRARAAVQLSMAAGMGLPSGGPPAPRREQTPEELAAATVRGAAKLQAAEEKRKRKADWLLGKPGRFAEGVTYPITDEIAEIAVRRDDG